MYCCGVIFFSHFLRDYVVISCKHVKLPDFLKNKTNWAKWRRVARLLHSLFYLQITLLFWWHVVFVEITNVIRVSLPMIVFVSLYLLVRCFAKLTSVIQLLVTLLVFDFESCFFGIFIQIGSSIFYIVKSICS